MQELDVQDLNIRTQQRLQHYYKLLDIKRSNDTMQEVDVEYLNINTQEWLQHYYKWTRAK